MTKLILFAGPATCGFPWCSLLLRAMGYPPPVSPAHKSIFVIYTKKTPAKGAFLEVSKNTISNKKLFVKRKRWWLFPHSFSLRSAGAHPTFFGRHSPGLNLASAPHAIHVRKLTVNPPRRYHMVPLLYIYRADPFPREKLNTKNYT